MSENKTDYKKVDVLVIGGGISGLVTAWVCEQSGLTVHVLESASEIGGNLSTKQVKGYTIERGPHSWIPSADAVWDLIDRLGLGDDVQQARPESAIRFVWREGRLHALPMSLGSFFGTGILSVSAKLRLMLEPLIPGRASKNDTLQSFFERRLGKEATRWLIGPFVSGVYAGDPEKLGARDAMNKMWEWEKQGGSLVRGARAFMKAKRKRANYVKRTGMFTFKGGLSRLPKRLAADLSNTIETNSTIQNIKKTDNGYLVSANTGTILATRLCLAIPPRPAANLVEPLSTHMAELLRTIELAPVSVVHLGLSPDDSQHIPTGFGFLVPRKQNIRLLGTVFLSKLYPDRAPEGHELLVCFVGGVFDPSAVQENDESLIRSCLDDLETVFDHRFSPEFTAIENHPQAIPQLVPGHVETIQALKTEAARVGSVAFAGNYMSGVGMNDAILSGLDAAEILLSENSQKAGHKE